jgi:hypothetical protein
MEFVFIGNPNDEKDQRGSVKLYGIEWRLNVPVKVTDERICQKLMHNNHFVLADGGQRFHTAPKLIVSDTPAIIPSVDAPAKVRRAGAKQKAMA